MDTSIPCPTCHQITTPSSIGQLCIGCEKVWHETPQKTPTPEPSLAIGLGSYDKVISRNAQLEEPAVQPQTLGPKVILEPMLGKIKHPETSPQDMRAGYEYSLRARLKRLVVPELPSGYDPSHSITSMSAKEISSTYTPSFGTTATNQSDILPLEPISHNAAWQEAEAIAMDIPSATRQMPPADYVIKPQDSPDDNKVNTSTNVRRSTFVLASTLFVTALVLGAGLWFTLHTKTPPRSGSSTANTSQAPSAAKKAINAPVVAADVLQRDTQRKKDLNDIATALEVYKQQQGLYPSGQDIAALYPLQYTTPPYISYINFDPSSTENLKIKYAYTSDGKNFTVQAKLENTADADAIAGYYNVRSR